MCLVFPEFRKQKMRFEYNIKFILRDFESGNGILVQIVLWLVGYARKTKGVNIKNHKCFRASCANFPWQVG